MHFQDAVGPMELGALYVLRVKAGQVEELAPVHAKLRRANPIAVSMQSGGSNSCGCWTPILRISVKYGFGSCRWVFPRSYRGGPVPGVPPFSAITIDPLELWGLLRGL